MVGKLEINIKKNAMAVMVSVIPNGDTNITEELLSEELQNRGIVSGVDRELFNEIAEHGIYKIVYIVAQGEYATPGKAGYYEFLFDKNVQQNIPRINEDGSVDYSPVIQMVEEGQLLWK